MSYTLPGETLRYYERGQEADRLESAFSRWEKVRTLDILDRFLPKAPAVVLDIGGAAGAYAFPLASRGYIVDLVDAVPLHVEQAKQRAVLNQPTPRSVQVGDARHLPFDDATADVVLLLGPLYHLTDAGDRLRALREAHRVLVDGGVLLVAVISRFASALDGIGRRLIQDPAFVAIMEQDLRTGQHENQTANQDYFTTAFFHRPEELHAELGAAGFPSPTLCAIEGPLWTVHPPESQEEQNALFRTMRLLENEQSLIGASAHIMGIATKRN